jgi:hypothetical protein
VTVTAASTLRADALGGGPAGQVQIRAEPDAAPFGAVGVPRQGTASRTAGGAARPSLIDPHPARGGSFGWTVTPLANGNVVVTNPEDNLVAVRSGAAYLFDSRTGALLADLVGSSAQDQVGGGGAPASGSNPGTPSAGQPGVGATPGEDAGAGGSGLGPDAAPQERVGDGVWALANGNYVVTSPEWKGGRGAATWEDGTAGVSGTIDASNSLVGSSPGDQVGFSPSDLAPGVKALTNGNYVVRSLYWNGTQGAATWGDGTAGVTGPVSAANSLVGSNPGDGVGYIVMALANGNYPVQSPSWNGNRGAVTWGDGTAGVTGPVDASNSLVGSNPGDDVGFDGVTVLANGNYLVASPYWNGGQLNGRGAVTWGDGTAGVSGIIDASNSLVGSNHGDQVGYGSYGGDGVTALANGNYVVHSPHWDGGQFDGRGAATWGDGTAGVTGLVSASNSLVGSNHGDQVAFNVTALTNGNYVVGSPQWGGGRGAATWGDGTTGVTGPVDASNSLVG